MFGKGFKQGLGKDLSRVEAMVQARVWERVQARIKRYKTFCMSFLCGFDLLLLHAFLQI